MKILPGCEGWARLLARSGRANFQLYSETSITMRRTVAQLLGQGMWRNDGQASIQWASNSSWQEVLPGRSQRLRCWNGRRLGIRFIGYLGFCTPLYQHRTHSKLSLFEINHYWNLRVWSQSEQKVERADKGGRIWGGELGLVRRSSQARASAMQSVLLKPARSY